MLPLGAMEVSVTDLLSEGERALPFHVRQGDVLVLEIDDIPKDARRVPRDDGRVVLAYGEVTGHAHAIRARRRRAPGTRR